MGSCFAFGYGAAVQADYGLSAVWMLEAKIRVLNGVFVEQTEVAFTVPEKNVEIRYTLDGSDPTIDCTGPKSVSKRFFISSVGMAIPGGTAYGIQMPPPIVKKQGVVFYIFPRRGIRTVCRGYTCLPWRIFLFCFGLAGNRRGKKTNYQATNQESYLITSPTFPHHYHCFFLPVLSCELYNFWTPVQPNVVYNCKIF